MGIRIAHQIPHPGIYIEWTQKLTQMPRCAQRTVAQRQRMVVGSGFYLRRGSSREFGQCVPKHQSQCPLAFRSLQICFTAQGIGFGKVVLAMNQIQRTAVGSGRHLSGKMVGQPALQVGGKADIEIIVLLTQEDIDAEFQFLGHPATLEKHGGPVPEILPPVGLRYRAHEPVPSPDILTEMLQKFVEGPP